MTAQEQQIDYLTARVKALENALKIERDFNLELSSTLTKRAENITVITNPDFDKPLSEIYKTY